MDLHGIRDRIDAIDAQLVALLCRRMGLSGEVGDYKRSHGIAVQDAGREAAILQRVSALSGVEYAPYTQRVYTALFQVSRAYQQERSAPGECAMQTGRAPERHAQYGLVGERLEGSLAAGAHTLLAPYAYALHTVSPDALAAFLRGWPAGGLDIAEPHKRPAAALCDTLTPLAAQLQSVSTVLCGDGRIVGHNTDAAAIRFAARQAGLDFAGRRVVIVGDNGTGRTAAYVAAQAGASRIAVIPPLGAGEVLSPDHAGADLLINASCVGMFPDTEAMPVPIDGFHHLVGVLDLLHSPLRSRLVWEAKLRGIPADGGLWMLIAQAAESVGLFCGLQVPETMLARVWRKLRMQTQNIVLVGMPGCGKTSVGQALAGMAGRPFWDIDEMVARMEGRPAGEIIRTDGEAAFRQLEARAVREASQQHGAIIATGGGSVLFAQNAFVLGSGGWMVHLRRPLRALSVDGRPLSGDVAAMARQRMPCYRSVSDVAVDNMDTIAAAARKIWDAFRAQWVPAE